MSKMGRETNRRREEGMEQRSRGIVGRIYGIAEYFGFDRANMSYLSRICIPISLATLAAVSGGLLFDGCMKRYFDEDQSSVQNVAEVRNVDESGSQLEMSGDSVGVKGGID